MKLNPSHGISNLKYQWLDIISLSYHLGMEFEDVVIRTNDYNIKSNIIEYAFDQTSIKFPNWPFIANKRADRFYNKLIMKYCEYSYDVHNYIEYDEIRKSFVCYVNNVNDLDQTFKLFENSITNHIDTNWIRKSKIQIPHQIEEED